MELEKLLNSTVFGFQTSAFYTHAAWQCLMRDVDRNLRHMRTMRVRAGYRPVRWEYLHCTCCEVADLLNKIGRWLTRWPQVMVALAVAAVGAHLNHGIMDFSYLPELPKHVSHLFTFKVVRGCGMGELAESKQEGEWCNPGEAMELLLPIEMEVREMMTALLEGLPELFG
jgi:hypothetical protein